MANNSPLFGGVLEVLALRSLEVHNTLQGSPEAERNQWMCHLLRIHRCLAKCLWMRSPKEGV
jgi:hypothetical protein